MRLHSQAGQTKAPIVRRKSEGDDRVIVRFEVVASDASCRILLYIFLSQHSVVVVLFLSAACSASPKPMRTSEVLALEEQYSRAATKASAKTNISRASRFVSVWKHKKRIAGEMGSFPRIISVILLQSSSRGASVGEETGSGHRDRPKLFCP